jgi:hypothetical protein
MFEVRVWQMLVIYISIYSTISNSTSLSFIVRPMDLSDLCRIHHDTITHTSGLNATSMMQHVYVMDTIH